MLSVTFVDIGTAVLSYPVNMHKYIHILIFHMYSW